MVTSKHLGHLGPAPDAGSPRLVRTGIVAGATVLAHGSVAAANQSWRDTFSMCHEADGVGTEVASQQISNGEAFELVAVRNAQDAVPSATGLLHLDSDGNPTGTIGSCTTLSHPEPGRSRESLDPVIDAGLNGAAINLDARTGQALNYGPMPDGATSVRLTWSDGIAR